MTYVLSSLLAPTVVLDVDVALLELLVEVLDLLVPEVERVDELVQLRDLEQPVSVPLSRRAVIWSVPIGAAYPRSSSLVNA